MPEDGQPVTTNMKRGQVIFRAARDGRFSAAGSTELRFVRIEFRGPESKITWGTTGFGPDSTMLVENGYARTYDIKIPAGLTEPRHTHHDRVVVCLSGRSSDTFCPTAAKKIRASRPATAVGAEARRTWGKISAGPISG